MTVSRDRCVASTKREPTRRDPFTAALRASSTRVAARHADAAAAHILVPVTLIVASGQTLWPKPV
jgi:hypothetical protein